MKKPLIGIPMGDPAGIGPEIAVKALACGRLYDHCRPLIIGEIETLKAIESIVRTGCTFNAVEKPEEGVYTPGSIDVISLANPALSVLEPGKVNAEAGRSAYSYIAEATKLALSGSIAAMATTPINKESIKAAGISAIGHTEMLAELTGTDDPLTMFQVRNMRVFFLSRHVSLRRSCDMVKKERLLDYIIRCDAAVRMLGVENSVMAVAGLNPHNGEHGLFGDEEGKEVEPAVAEARAKGINVVGPVPADSVFHQALMGKYGAVLSLYHDQGHIATKTVDFERTISLTIGMPFLRTSVDHGTAFDIAGKGIASSLGMEEAIRLAAEYAPLYRKV